ncbi:MAG: adenosylcobinamide-phosphate synthase CbiB [Pseudomonadota bacterium]
MILCPALSSYIWIILAALMIEVIISWPKALHKRISHPVVWIGSLITLCEKKLNKGSSKQRLRSGGLTVAIVLGTVGLTSAIIEVSLPKTVFGDSISALCMASLLSTRNLYDHVLAVARPLEHDDITKARKNVAMIVGRDPNQLDASGISRATIESLAENTSDGIIAPVFWALIAGLPGMILYKAINTLDSMIAYRNDRYEYFGKYAAKLDDLANWLPARITAGLFLILKPQNLIRATKTVWKNAPKHRSPNAGWPESAMATLLNVRLSGPRMYHNRQTEDPWINEQGRGASPKDIRRALTYYKAAIGILAIILIIIANLIMN